MSVFSPRLGGSDGLTPEQLQLNLATARRMAAEQLGLNLSDRANWEYGDRLKYDKLLAAVILTYPDRFSDQEIQNAYHESNTTFQDLGSDNVATEYHVFIDTAKDTLLQGGQKMADLGNGVLNFFSGVGKGLDNTGAVAKAAVPAIGIIAAGVLLVALAARTGATRPSTPGFLQKRKST